MGQTADGMGTVSHLAFGLYVFTPYGSLGRVTDHILLGALHKASQEVGVYYLLPLNGDG